MYILILLFLIFVTVHILESFFAYNGFPFYFRTGIIIYKKIINKSCFGDIGSFENILNNKLKRRGMIPAFVFKNISYNEISFRRKYFEFPVAYSGIMHGIIIFEINKNKIVVKGLCDWFLITFLLYWYTFLIDEVLKYLRQSNFSE
jgi:hypothetical protein